MQTPDKNEDQRVVIVGAGSSHMTESLIEQLGINQILGREAVEQDFLNEFGDMPNPTFGPAALQRGQIGIISSASSVGKSKFMHARTMGKSVANIISLPHESVDKPWSAVDPVKRAEIEQWNKALVVHEREPVNKKLTKKHKKALRKQRTMDNLEYQAFKKANHV